LKDEALEIRYTSYSLIPYFKEVNLEILVELNQIITINNLSNNDRLLKNCDKIFELILKSKELNISEKNKLIATYKVYLNLGNARK